jgi:hypothetical protein
LSDNETCSKSSLKLGFGASSEVFSWDLPRVKLEMFLEIFLEKIKISKLNIGSFNIGSFKNRFSFKKAHNFLEIFVVLVIFSRASIST